MQTFEHEGGLRMALLLRRWFLKASVLMLGASSARAWWIQDDLEFEEASYDDAGKSIPIEVIRPVGQDRRLPVVLLLHGKGVKIPDEGTRGIARGLARRGYVAMLPHYAKCRDPKYASWVQATRHAIDFAAGRPAVDPDAIGLLGVSLGGMIVLSAACREPKVKAVAELFAGWPQNLPDEHPEKLPPVLMLHGDADKIATVEDATKLDSLLTEHKIVHRYHLYKKLGHGFSGKTLEDGFRRISSFFDETLKKAPVAGGAARSKSKKKR